MRSHLQTAIKHKKTHLGTGKKARTEDRNRESLQTFHCEIFSCEELWSMFYDFLSCSKMLCIRQPWAEKKRQLTCLCRAAFVRNYYRVGVKHFIFTASLKLEVLTKYLSRKYLRNFLNFRDEVERQNVPTGGEKMKKVKWK